MSLLGARQHRQRQTHRHTQVHGAMPRGWPGTTFALNGTNEGMTLIGTLGDLCGVIVMELMWDRFGKWSGYGVVFGAA